MEYTKGDWVVLAPNYMNPSRAMVCSSAGAEIYSAPLTNETLANAHLIAAAPNQNKALKMMLSAYEQLRQAKPLLFNMLDGQDAMLYKAFEDACIETEKVLAKAEGKV
jgi:hypothetical protein